MNGHQHQLPLRPMSDTFTVVCEINGTSHSFSCSAEQTVLAAAEAAGVELPSSCCSGVCAPPAPRASMKAACINPMPWA